jgi:hypothetical protein
VHGHGLQNHELLSLLSYKTALELYSTKGNKNKIAKTPSVKGLHASSLPQIPQLDLFARTDTRKSQVIEPKLTSPLLDQDLATITAFLKERRAQRRLQALRSLEPKLPSTSFVTDRLPIQSQSFPQIQREITHVSLPEQNMRAAITKNIKSRSSLTPSFAAILLNILEYGDCCSFGEGCLREDLDVLALAVPPGFVREFGPTVNGDKRVA